MSLAIEERKRKIDLLNAQIEYWKTLTKKLDANNGHNPTPSCLCHFPAKVNGLQSQQSSSQSEDSDVAELVEYDEDFEELDALLEARVDQQQQ